MHIYEVRPRKDKRGVDLISDALPSPHPLHRSRQELPMGVPNDRRPGPDAVNESCTR